MHRRRGLGGLRYRRDWLLLLFRGLLLLLLKYWIVLLSIWVVTRINSCLLQNIRTRQGSVHCIEAALIVWSVSYRGSSCIFDL